MNTYTNNQTQEVTQEESQTIGAFQEDALSEAEAIASQDADFEYPTDK